MDEKIDILLSRYFSGEATEEELQSLDRWLAQSPENEAYFEEMTTIFQHAGFAGPMPEPDTEKALPAFKNHCRVNNETIQKPESEKTRKREIASLSLISRFRVFAPHLSIAASILLIAGISLFFFKKTNNQVHIAASNTAVQQELFEGVFVSLEAGTEIAYNPENIQEVVLLKGEATFDVTSPRNGQLLVRVGETLIRDIGTVFTVTAHNPGESIMVTVTEGEVLFYAQNNAGIRIKQSGKGIFHPQKNFFEHIAPPAGITAAGSYQHTFRSI